MVMGINLARAISFLLLKYIFDKMIIWDWLQDYTAIFIAEGQVNVLSNPTSGMLGCASHLFPFIVMK